MPGTMCVFNTTRQSFLSLQIRRAATPLARLKGLLGILRLRHDEGVWTIPSQGVHTVGLLFAIDLVYLDQHCRVIHVVENLSPFRFSPVKIKAHSVLQLATHTIHASRTHRGDQLLICSPEVLKEEMEKQRHLVNVT